MPYSNRTREFSFKLDVGTLSPAPTGGTTSANRGWAVIGAPTFPTMAIDKITEQSGAPYEEALEGVLPLANRRLEWDLAEWDDTLLRIGGRPYEFLGGATNDVVAKVESKPRFIFTAVSRRSADENIKITEFAFEGALDPCEVQGLTGGEYARLHCVVPDVRVMRIRTSAWVDLNTRPSLTPDAATVLDIDLREPKYVVNGYDRWAGLKTALGI